MFVYGLVHAWPPQMQPPISLNQFPLLKSIVDGDQAHLLWSKNFVKQLVEELNVKGKSNVCVQLSQVKEDARVLSLYIASLREKLRRHEVSNAPEPVEPVTTRVFIIEERIRPRMVNNPGMAMD